MKNQNSITNILALMYRMDNGYSKAVNLNENSQAYFLVEGTREKQAWSRSMGELQKIFGSEGYNEEQLSAMLKSFEDKFYHDPKMRSSSVRRLEPLFCRIAFEDFDFGKNDADQESLSRLIDILNFLYRKKDEIDLVSLIPNPSLYTLSFFDLEDMVGEAMNLEADTEYKEINDTEYTPNDYEIIGPLDYEKAHEIGNLSCPYSLLCYTQSEQTWQNYTDSGRNNAYVALRKGWNDERLFPAIHDDKVNESPYDKYGLSMIFVFVAPNYGLAYCNTRWNHTADYPDGVQVDHALNRKQVSEIIGMNFFKAFKPNLEFKEKMDEALAKYNKGDYSGFSSVGKQEQCGCRVVSLLGKSNYIKNGEYLSNMWFDGAAEFTNGYARVRKNHKWNLISNDGKLVWRKPFNKWFDFVSDFYYGISTVSIFSQDKKSTIWNYMNTNGVLISKEWFKSASFFGSCKVGRVEIGDKMNIINTNGDLLLEKGYDSIGEFDRQTNLAKVRWGRRYNFIRPSGELLMKQWYDDIDDFCGRNYTIVRMRHRYNLINLNGQLIWKKPRQEWFTTVDEIDGNCAIVSMGEKSNVLNLLTGRMFWDKPVEQWFGNCGIDDGLVFMCQDDKLNFLTKDGELAWKHPVEEWFDNIWNFYDGYARVVMGDKINYIDKNAKLLWDKPYDEWFDYGEINFSLADGGVNVSYDNSNEIYQLTPNGTLKLIKRKLNNGNF